MSIVIGNNLPESVSTSSWSPAAALRESEMPATLRLVCDTLSQEEFDAVRAHAKQCKPTVKIELICYNDLLPAAAPLPSLPRPKRGEPLVPANGRKGTEDYPTSVWYTELFTHALHTSRPTACCVLSGPPGVGKTLAAEHLLEEVQQMKERAQKAGVVPLSRFPQVRYFTCSLLESASDLGPFLGSIAAYGATAHPDDVLVVDDIEALGGRAKREKLFEIMARRVRCRRIMITNDFYDAKSFPMRTSTLKEHFFPLTVTRAHIGSLAQYIMQHFPALGTSDDQDANVQMQKCAMAAQRIAQQSLGDVRAALTTAMLDVRMRNTDVKRSVGVSIDVQNRGEAMHVTLQRLARTAERTTLPRVHKTFFDNQHEQAAETMFANYARLLTALPETIEREVDEGAELLVRMQAAADAADMLSLGEQYDYHRREHSYAGIDGLETDKEVVFAFTVGAPLAHVARAVREATQHYGVVPCHDFPFYNLMAQQKITTEALGPLWARMNGMLHSSKPSAQKGTAFSGGTFTMLEDAKAVLFGGLRGTALKNVLESDGGERMQALVQRFVEFGCDEQVFVCMCRARMGDNRYSAKKLGAVFQACSGSVSAPKQRNKRAAASSSTVQSDEQGKKKKKSAPAKRQRTVAPPPANVSVLGMMRRMSKQIAK